MTLRFHLCQNGPLSCGACCGAYTRAGEPLRALQDRLEGRGDDFEARVDVASPESLAAFRRRHRRPDHLPELPLKDCAFLGRLPESGRVGCLLHPARGRGGFDGRDAGVYDRLTCASFRCAAYSRWSEEEQALIAGACGEDSLLYGWVLNDFALIEPFFAAIRRRTGGAELAHHHADPDARAALRELLLLKRDWIDRDEELPLTGQVLPDTSEAVPLEPVHAVILAALGSAFDEPAQEREAEAIIEACLARAVAVVERLSDGDQGAR